MFKENQQMVIGVHNFSFHDSIFAVNEMISGMFNAFQETYLSIDSIVDQNDINFDNIEFLNGRFHISLR